MTSQQILNRFLRKGRPITGTMSKTTRNNLMLAMVPLLISEGLMIYPVFFNNFPLWQLLVPISLLTLVPIAALQDAWENGSYGSLLAIISFDVIFLWIMAYSITKNHKTIGGVCLCVFILLSVAAIGGSS